MPLPFMQKRQVAGLIIQKRAADGAAEPEQPEDSGDQALESCAEDMIRAVHAKDSQGVAAAMRAAFQIMESEPHDEADEASEAPEVT